jgi:hypothetical protein
LPLISRTTIGTRPGCLEKALYRLRDADIDALREFESACVAHDREMPQIRKAMIREYGGVATLWTYRQMAICKKKSKDFGGGVEWCRRGLAIYGTDAIPQDRSMVTDLERRLAWFEQQLR